MIHALDVKCPKWHNTIFRIVPDGIEIACRSCRNGVVHTYSCEQLQRAWEELQKQKSIVVVEEHLRNS